MSIRNICTPQELKEFADTTQLTIDNLSKFIESKTNQEHLIIQKEFIKAVCLQLSDNIMHIFDINRFLNEIWGKIVSTNQNTTDKWKESLKVFET